jgi:hypothetical protein
MKHRPYRNKAMKATIKACQPARDIYNASISDAAGIYRRARTAAAFKRYLKATALALKRYNRVLAQALKDAQKPPIE